MVECLFCTQKSKYCSVNCILRTVFQHPWTPENLATAQSILKICSLKYLKTFFSLHPTFQVQNWFINDWIAECQAREHNPHWGRGEFIRDLEAQVFALQALAAGGGGGGGGGDGDGDDDDEDEDDDDDDDDGGDDDGLGHVGVNQPQQQQQHWNPFEDPNLIIPAHVPFPFPVNVDLFDIGLFHQEEIVPGSPPAPI